MKERSSSEENIGSKKRLVLGVKTRNFFAKNDGKRPYRGRILRSAGVKVIIHIRKRYT